MQKGSAARKSFPDVDALVFGIKKFFKKSPRRIQKFREICSDLPLPPEPVSTRWTTWLKAVHYLNNHHEQMLRVISTFNPDELAVIEKCQKLLINPAVVQQIQCIDRNHSFLIDIILQLEGNLSLWDSLKLLDIVCEKLSDPVSKAKFDENMAKNPGLKILSDMVKGKFSDRGNLWTAGDRDLLDRVSIQNCFVERSFSRYKDILSCRRQSLPRTILQKICFALVTL